MNGRASRKRLAYAALAWMLSALVAHAGFLTGNDLLQSCEANQASSFVAGVYDAYEQLITFRHPAGSHPRICLPPHTILRQLRDVVCNSVQAHPESRTEDAADLALVSLVAAFPCPDPK